MGMGLPWAAAISRWKASSAARSRSIERRRKSLRKRRGMVLLIGVVSGYGWRASTRWTPSDRRLQVSCSAASSFLPRRVIS